ncbi:hypothetical protein DL769_000128 [Monosporascus sp. CRB-8-3]|nr:hypothetical protein DL769_000128 [Monosporascus sp. CRB-8-3]
MGSFLNRSAGLSALFAAAVHEQDFKHLNAIPRGWTTVQLAGLVAALRFLALLSTAEYALIMGVKITNESRRRIVPNALANPLYIAPVESGVQLPDGMFLTVNKATDAKDPVLERTTHPC